MSRVAPLKFQDKHIDVLTKRFGTLKERYDSLGPSRSGSAVEVIRKNSACVLLQAPTGSGKTLIGIEAIAKFSATERVIWFWFAPFAGVVSQTKLALKAQAPALSHLEIGSDRKAANLTQGAVFVLTWQTVVSTSKDARLARQTGDRGLGVDDLIDTARKEGFRIGVVVDEAHHGFVKASGASKFFAEVLKPDYVLLMTATPRDADAAAFSKLTGYVIGGPSEWASVTREEGVKAQLLKTSIKAARFIAKSQDDAQLLKFEEVALSECAIMHRHIKDQLKSTGVDLVPLMLVQVPNGDDAIAAAHKYLTDTLKFSPESVKSHTAAEPDPNLLALARDPSIEVIIFKMAIATGFDAPRAFTLAALRGARDKAFGIQVVGRILRVHKLLQGKMDVIPPVLRYGYVFLANSEAQEGLRTAATEINQMPEQLAEATPSTVVTIVAGQAHVQVVHAGQTLSLLPAQEEVDGGEVSLAEVEESTDGTGQPWRPGMQTTLFDTLNADAGAEKSLVAGLGSTSKLVEAFELEASTALYRYARIPGVPKELETEKLPKTADDVEQQLANYIDFTPVLADRGKIRTKLTERMSDVFAPDAPEDRDIFAKLSPAAIAEKARQSALSFPDADRRELLKSLKARLKGCLLEGGFEVPESEEELTQQLELILVRNESLVRNAFKRLRADQVVVTKAHLPEAIDSIIPLPPAKRASYGIFPVSLGTDEIKFAEMLDTAGCVEWWHRNVPGATSAESVGLYSWSGGTGFYPDFVVKLKDRKEGDGIALIEIKGRHLLQYEKAKAAARHPSYGRVFMVGRVKPEGDFRLWRLTSEGELVDDGKFEFVRLYHS
ncbi:DEAD/DEAH box helicase [Paraburkholderia sp. DGU8]|uniref:DEAD/DEAH box helicase n=1 Tax=Paraburkholderia sp. DGU8 TaxID=3161997 RepID=UPI00346597F5